MKFVTLAVELLKVSARAEHVLLLCSSLYAASKQPVIQLEGQGKLIFVSVASLV